LRAVIGRGLLDECRSILVWGGSLGALGAFMAAIYPSIQDSLGKLAGSYPAGLKKAFGVEDLGSVEAYVHAELFSLIVPLAVGFFAVRSVAGAIAGAEEHGQLDTLLSLPMPRAALTYGSFVVSCLAAGAILTLCGLVTFAAGRIAGTGISLGLTAAGVAGVWPLAVFGAGIATLACGAFHRGRAVIGLGVGTLVAMYAVDVAGRLSTSLAPLRWASVFRYYGAPFRDGIDIGGFLLTIGVGAALAVMGTVFFDRRDVLR
jgi:ABC-2 type transport system permease protein